MSTTFANDNPQASATDLQAPEIYCSRELPPTPDLPPAPNPRHKTTHTRLQPLQPAANPAGNTLPDLATRCREALRWTTTLPEDSIQIHIESNRVVVRGSVANASQAQTVQEVLRSVDGVTNLTNEIQTA